MANKITDINARSGGRAGNDNEKNYINIYADKFKPLRTPALTVKRIFSPTSVERLPQFITQTYKFGGIEFGNWVNQLRRVDFCLNTIAACYDMQKVLNFPNNNLGISGKIGLAFGARGYARAFAHYEPATMVINLTRDRRVDKAAVDLFGNKLVEYNKNYELYQKYAAQLRAEHSGYGSLAHEYGHALDYICGEFFTKYDTALSGGRLTLTSFKNENRARLNFDYAVLKPKRNELQEAFITAFESFLFTGKDYDKPSGFYRRVYTFGEKRGEYWMRLNEIWARIFETYIAYKLSKQGIVNKVLVRDGKGKYRNELKNQARNVYPTFGEMQKNVRKMDNFIKQIQKLI
jgi:hypothetical protein